MFRFRKFEKCRGLSIGPFGQYLIEFWWIPRNYEVKEHTHNHQNMKLIFLFCHNALCHRRKKNECLGKTVWVTWRDIGRVFHINAGDAHSVNLYSWPLLFMNIEKYEDGYKPSSASIDMEVSNA